VFERTGKSSSNCGSSPLKLLCERFVLAVLFVGVLCEFVRARARMLCVYVCVCV
jgi:hypothetical protein